MDGEHQHPALTNQIATLDNQIAAMEERLAALEAGGTQPGPGPTPPPSGRVEVARSVVDMKGYAANNDVDEVQIAGAMPFSPGYPGGRDTLWLAGQTAGAGHNIAARTNPLIIRATSPVTFDGQGKSGLGGLVLMEGVHDIEFLGSITMHNFVPAAAGALGIGGADVNPAYRIAPHHIGFDDLTIAPSVHRSSASNNQDHAAYIADAHGEGPHHIEVRKYTVIATDPLCLVGGIHAYHGNGINQPAHHITFRKVIIKGTISPIILWWDDPAAKISDWLIDGAAISNIQPKASGGKNAGVVFEDHAQRPGALVLKDVFVAAPDKPFASSLGPNPVGVTFVGGNLRAA
jgi:hypothetical protein